MKINYMYVCVYPYTYQLAHNENIKSDKKTGGNSRKIGLWQKWYNNKIRLADESNLGKLKSYQ